MHFSAHSLFVCVFRHSFTFPNAPWPRFLITTYWFRNAFPRRSLRSVAVAVCRKSAAVNDASRPTERTEEPAPKLVDGERDAPESAAEGARPEPRPRSDAIAREGADRRASVNAEHPK